MALLVRAAVPGDAEAVSTIYVASWNRGFAGLLPPRHHTRELVAQWERELGAVELRRWWVADLDGTIVGFAGIGPSRDPIDPTIGELDTIAVEPGHWRSGVGRALMAVAVEHFAADGYREAILWTLADYEPGHAFYEATGWTRDGGVRADGREVRYRRRLDPPAPAP